MRCQTCGEELREGARFCPTCGTPTEPGAVPAAPTVQIRRQPDQGQTVAGAPEEAPSPQAPEPEPGARASRDPGAGYDPLGPSRPAPQPGQAPATAPPRPAGPPPPASTAPVPAGFTAPTGADWNTLVARLQRLARLDTSVLGEIYADAAATIPVAVFAAVVLVLSGIGGMLFIANSFGFDVYGSSFSDGHGAGEFFLLSVIIGTLFALASLAAWSGIAMLLLRQLFGVQANFYGLARVFGVSIVPMVLALLLFWTDAVVGLTAVAFGGVAALAVIGVLESLDTKPGHAWLATLAGFAVFVLILSVLGHDTLDLAPGFFSVT